jgi:hypothetical protein
MLSQHLCYTAKPSAPSSATSVADPGSGVFLTPGSEIKSSIILSKLAYFFQHFKNKMIFYFVKFVATKNGMTTNLFYHSLLLLFIGPGSGMGKNQDPG